MFIRIFLIIFLIITFSCAKKENEIYSPSKKINSYLLYQEALDAMKKNEYFFASKKFSEAELNFEVPSYAAKAALMSAFSLYGINLYDEAIETLERYLKNYPADKNIIYAHYLTAIIYFEQIGDEEHDLKPLTSTREKIDFFLKKYPKTEYAIDLSFKKNLVQNQFAAKEMYIAKYYVSVQKWIPAINRLKLIVEDYDKTVFVEEALHRLVEIHYHLGLLEEANKYASVLGYNYNSSEWFKKSYKVLNKDYSPILTNKPKKKKGLIKKIINMIK